MYNMQAYEIDNIEFDQPKEEYQIKSDSEAGWAMRKIKAIRAQRDRFIAQCQERKAAYSMEMDAKITACSFEADREERYFLAMLRAYADQLPDDAYDVSKVGTRNYRLPEGKIMYKPAKVGLTHNPDVLLPALKAYGLAQYVQTKETPKWAEVKKACVVDGDQVAIPNEDGELIPLEGISVETKPASFEVEVK
jgi:hypothetical protein